MASNQPLLGYGDSRSFLVNLAERGRLPAAVLLVGPPMIGKTTLLEHVARFILCAKQSFCQRCESCLLDPQIHPDILRYSLEEDGEGRPTLTSLLRRLRERPVTAPKLVVFLENIDGFSGPSLALLLKAIEDAPRYAHILLTAESVERIPETIRSRALVRALAPLQTSELARELQRTGIPPAAAEVHAKLSGGRPGLARRLATDLEMKRQYLSWHETAERLAALSLRELTDIASALDRQPAAAEFLRALQGVIRDRLRARPGGVNTERQLLTLLRRSREAAAMIQANVPPRLALEYVFFAARLSLLRSGVASASQRTQLAIEA